MTYREQIADVYPDLVDDEYCGGVSGCPHFYLNAERPSYCKTGPATDAKCRKCWNREVKDND